MTKLSFMFPQQPSDPDAILAWGRLCQDIGSHRMWLGQSLRIESHTAIAYLAGSGCHISVGMAVGLTPLRHPYDAALQARGLAAVLRRPVAIGYGAAFPSFVSSVHGAPYAKPARTVGEYIEIARKLARGESVSFDGEVFTVHARLPEMATAEVEIGAGVLRSGMARMAGRFGDFAVTWLTPRSYLTGTVMPALAQGAAGVQQTPRVISVIHAAVERPGRSPYLLAQHGSITHLQAAHYTDMLRRAGLDVHPTDPISGAREIVQHGIYVYGSPEHIAQEFARYHAIGVDEIIINPCSVSNMYGYDAAMEDLRDIFAAFAAQNEPTTGGVDDATQLCERPALAGLAAV